MKTRSACGLRTKRSIRALGIVATPPALNYDPRLLERVDDFAVEHSKVQTAGVAVGTRISPRPPHRSRRALLTRIMQRFDGYDEADGAIA